MGYSRRDLYALGEPLGENVTRKKAGGGMVYGGGDSPAPSQPTSTTAYNTNIPEYAKPYVTNMLEATQRQLFKGSTDANGNFNITGFQPYQPYSNNPQDYVAGFSPLQQQAHSGAANLQMPGQFQAGSQLAGAAGLGSLGIARQANNAGNNYFGMATNPGTVNQFMNPYLQDALNPALAEARRQYGITGQQEQGNATQAGAFGGSREALMAAENNRNMNTGMNQMIGQGYNQAYNQAQNNILQGNQLGLQGYQTGLQGYGQGIQAANAMGQLGASQLQGQEGILGLQNQMGGQEQAQQQQIINQQIQNYATAQQYPMMQLGLMSNMLRGLPMQATTTQSYQAQPSALTQGIGALGAGVSAYKAFGAKGGLPKDFEVKRYAPGGIAGSVMSELEGMDDAHLQQVMQSSSSKEIKQMAGKVLAEHEIANQAMGKGLGAAPSNMPTQMAGGGIVAFAGETDGSLVQEEEPKNPLIADNPYAATPEAALEKYMAMRKTAGASEGDPYAKYAEAIKAKLASSAEDRDRMNAENALTYFANFGTQPGGLLKAGTMAAKETVPGIIKNREAFDKEQLGYEAAGADILNKQNTAAEAAAKEASTLFEKGADIQEKLSAKLIEAQKTKSLPNLQELTKINYEYLITKDPSIANDPTKAAKAKVDATNTAVQQLGYIQQQIGLGRNAIAAQGVDVSRDVAETGRLSAISGLSDKKTARADDLINKDKRLGQLNIDLMGAETPAEKARISKQMDQREEAIRLRVDKEFAPAFAAYNALGGSQKSTGGKGKETDKIDSNNPLLKQ
jgi:hypothetical protein